MFAIKCNQKYAYAGLEQNFGLFNIIVRSLQVSIVELFSDLKVYYGEELNVIQFEYLCYLGI